MHSRVSIVVVSFLICVTGFAVHQWVATKGEAANAGAEACSLPGGCTPTLPWYDYDPATCPFKQAPFHIYQRSGFISKDEVQCLERLKICETRFERKEVVKRGTCPKEAFWQVPEGLMVCCTNWDKAVKSGKPCNPGLDANCDGTPNGKDKQIPFNGRQYMQDHKPDYVWTSGAGGSVKIYSSCGSPLGSVVAVENNGTMLHVLGVSGSKTPQYYGVEGERAGATYKGCIPASDIACDPAKVRK